MTAPNEKTPAQTPPDSFQFPSENDLAKTAASLHPALGANAEQSLREALILHIAAWMVRKEWKDRPFSDLLVELNCSELNEWALSEVGKHEKLRLYPEGAVMDASTKAKFFAGDLDPVRQYLNEKQKYGGWGKTRTVLHNIRLLHLDQADRHNRRHARTIQQMDKLHQKMAAEKGWTVEELRNGMDMMPEERRRDGQQEYEELLSQYAVFKPTKCPAGSPKELEEPLKVEYWNLPVSFLDRLMAWRLGVKTNGGVKELEKRLLRPVPAKTPGRNR